MFKQYYVYIMTNQGGTTLYVGVTGDLIRRCYEHRTGAGGVFTTRYACRKLVYYEQYGSVIDAISREKVIKGGSRKKKIELINGMNPMWRDLYDDIVG